MGRPSTDYTVDTSPDTPATSTTKLPFSAHDSLQTLHSQPKPPTPSLKLLFSFLTRHDLYFLVCPAIAAAMASGAVAPFMTLVVGNVFDAFARFPLSNPTQDDKNTLRHDIGVTALELLGLALGALALSSITSCLWIWTGERNLLAVRKRVYNAVTRKELVWFDTQTGKDTDDSLGAGGLMAKFTRETDEVRTATSLACGMFIQYLTTTVVCLALGFSRSWALTLVILSAVPVLTVIQTISQNLVAPHLGAERSQTATAATLVDRAVAAIATVKAFNAQSYEERNLALILDKLQSSANACITVWGCTATLSHFAMMAMFVQGFWFGAKLVRSGTISPGDVMAVFWACLIATSNLQMCIPQLIVIAKGKFAMASLVTLAQSTADPTVGHSASTLYTPLKPSRHTSTLRKIIPATCKGGLELCDVTFAYPSRPDVPVLRDVSIFLPAQELTFIVGASGSGKTTVGQLLLRMYHLHAGQGMLKLDEHDLAHLDLAWSREQVAGVSQTCILFDMTVHENVAMGLASPASKRRPEDVTRAEVEAVCRAALMHQFISDLPNGYDTKLGNGGANLSGGQKQRLAIARALLRNPTVLILDEATSALDPTSRVLVFEAIKKWRQNKTTIVITHDLSQITEEDFVYVLKNGEVVEQGFRSDLETAGEEFSRMLAVGFQERTDDDLAKDGVQLEAILEQADADIEEDLEAAGVTATDLKRSSIYRPLTMSNWMFDVVADLTKTSVTAPSAAVAPAPNRNSHRISRFVPQESFSEEPATPVSPASSRPKSLHIDIPSLTSPPLARTMSRRYSLQFTPTSPTYTHSSFLSATVIEDGEDDEKKLLEHRVLHPSRSISSLNAKAQVQKRERIKWDQGKLIELTEVKVENSETRAEEPIPAQPSFFALMRDVWPTIPLKPLLILGMLLSMASGAMTPVFSFVLSRLQYEVSIGATDVSAVNVFGGLSLAIAAGDGLLIGLKYFVMEYTAMDWVNRLRKTCIGLVLAQDKRWFDRSAHGPARLVQILIKDGDDSRSLIATVFAQALVVSAMLGVGLVWALVQGWQLTLVGFALAPVFGVTMAIQTNLVAKCEYRNRRAREEVSRGYYDAISNVRGIRAMGFENVFQEKFERSADHALTTGVRGAFVEGCTHGVASALIYLSEAVLFYVGAVLVANGTYGYLRMVQVLNLVVFTVTIGSQLMSFTQRIAKSVQATQDFNALLKLQKRTDESEGSLRPPVAGDVSFSNVSFSYPERSDVPVLKDLSFSIADGECVAIVGSSGSGKSTIASLLQRLYEPNMGSISIGHHPIHHTDVRHLRDHVAVVSQQPNLFDATIAENIAYGTQGVSMQQIHAAARAANVHDFILSLPKGYETVVGENASLISGGQAQRLQIARALVRPSTVLILDECTSALDPANQLAVLETIRRAKVGRTTLMITHKLPVMQMCDRILVVHEGAVVEQGTFHELVEKRGVFSQLAHGGEWMD